MQAETETILNWIRHHSSCLVVLFLNNIVMLIVYFNFVRGKMVRM